MDELNRVTLLEMCPPEYRDRVRLLLEFAPHLGRNDVPDPYYGGANGFEHVLDLVEEAAAGRARAPARDAAPPDPPPAPPE